MISIVIPVYPMHGHGAAMLTELLDSLQKQTYQEYEVIVSDDSSDTSLQDICGNYESVKYYRNPGAKGACSNLNNAIRHSKGSIIKPMFQDDQFLDTDALEKISTMKAPWCVLTSAHIGEPGAIPRADHNPYPNEDIYELARGCNTYGSPSAVAWKRGGNGGEFGLRLAINPFDENLKWLFDCDFYAQMVQENGQPEFIPSRVLIREWDGMATRTIADGGVRIQELAYIESKYSNLRP